MLKLEGAYGIRLEAIIWSTAFKLCFQFLLAPLHVGGVESRHPARAENAMVGRRELEPGAYTRPLFSSTAAPFEMLWG
jgi:hypothetical protein